MDLDVHLASIAAGDQSAFGRWVAGSELRLRASLASFAAVVDVEAVLQETLLRVWQLAPRFQPDGRPEALLRFAIRVARNRAVSELRRHGREIPLELEPEPPPPIEPDPLLRELILRCREELPPKPALALNERLLGAGSEPDRELAARLGMTLNTFLQNVTRARKLLGECLERGGARFADLATRPVDR